MSESNRVKVYYVKESVYGETPVNADWKTLRYTSESLTSNHNNVSSSEIRADRMVADSTRVSSEAAGELNIEFSALSFDDLLEAAMADTWEVDGADSTLKIGTTAQSFSIEKDFDDVGRYFSFSGMRVGQMNLNVSYGEIMTASFSFMGNNADASDTSKVGTGDILAAPTTDVLNATTDLSTVTINGSPTNVCIQSLSLSLDNTLRNRVCIGNVFPVNIAYGTANVSGSIELYFSANAFAIYQNVLSNADVSFSFAVEDEDYRYTFNIPRAKLVGSAPVSTGIDTDIVLSFDFTALLDPTSESSLVITKTEL